MIRRLIACAATLALVGIAAAQAPNTQRPDPRTSACAATGSSRSVTMR